MDVHDEPHHHHQQKKNLAYQEYSNFMGNVRMMDFPTFRFPSTNAFSAFGSEECLLARTESSRKTRTVRNVTLTFLRRVGNEDDKQESLYSFRTDVLSHRAKWFIS